MIVKWFVSAICLVVSSLCNRAQLKQQGMELTTKEMLALQRLLEEAQ